MVKAMVQVGTMIAMVVMVEPVVVAWSIMVVAYG
jgi:hypothetical protein